MAKLSRPQMPPRSVSDFSTMSSFTSLSLDDLNNNNVSPPEPQSQPQLPPQHPKVLDSSNYRSPYYVPFKSPGTTEPKPVEILMHRFSIWKMIVKQLVFYFKELSIFKKQTYLANKAMFENLNLLRKQNNFARHKKTNSALKATKSAVDLTQSSGGASNGSNGNGIFANSTASFMQNAFLPEAEHSVLSISTTLYNYHADLAEKELITYNQLTLKIIPRLENLKENLNDAIKQMSTLRGSSEFKLNDLKSEIAKTGALLADYMASIELLTKGETTTSLGTKLNFTKLEPKNDPYLLRLKLDLQLKNQLYSEAHLKEAYFDLQHKSVQLEQILYKEVQDCLRTFVNLINAELDAGKNSLVVDMMDGFLKNEYGIDWDYFINNDDSKNTLKLSSHSSLLKEKQIRKKSDVLYPYQRDKISAPLISGFLDKRSKYLKTYSRFFYVLTFNFIHEFRTDDRKKEKTPVSSYSLSDMVVSESADDPKKFIIRINHRTSEKNKFTFRCPDKQP
ncbi:unnamed protein product [Ambrosiozyma monospora]|uniref:Unnamed protein product n=1 Tax=Ambrosiozyma monospora TaxID=43982 RepID=A0ACB5T6I7_AMBMO|nr:unnamed protein product [Ambrosiozyma monospora]